MISKNNLILTLLLLFLFLTSLISAVTLVTVCILGYTGFDSFNQKNDLIQLSTACSHQYFTDKYSEWLLSSIRVGFICEFITFGASILALMIVIAFVCGCQCACLKGQAEAKSDTGIGDSQSNFNTYLHISYPTTVHISNIYLLISILILTVFVPFKQYLQYLIQENNSLCPLNLSNSQIYPITILNGVTLCLGLLSMTFLVALNCRVQDRLDLLEKETKSQSYRHQIERMIRELPETERRFAFKNEDRVVECKEEYKFGSPPPKQDRGLSELEKVQSVLYNANPSLRLQSAVSSD